MKILLFKSSYHLNTIIKMHRLSLCTLFCLLFTFSSFGQIYNKPLKDLFIERWTTDDGLPNSTVLRVMQSSDGYLWVATFGGLARFDGESFTTFNNRNSPLFNTNIVRTIKELKNGDIVFGGELNGLMKYSNGKIKKVLEADRLPTTFTIAEKENGGLWLGTQKGLYLYENDTLILSYLDGISINAVIYSNDSTLWVAADNNGIFRLKDDLLQHFTTEQGLPTNNVYALAPSNDHSIWVGTQSGLTYFNGESFDVVSQTDGISINVINEDTRGNVWMGTQSGLFRYNYATQDIQFLNEENGLLNDDLLYLIFDHEQSLWTASYRAGLIRFRPVIFNTITAREGLPPGAVATICDLGNEEYLIGTDARKVMRYKDGQTEEYKFKTDISRFRVKHINQDSKKNIWISVYGGLLKVSPNGKEAFFTQQNGNIISNLVRLTFEDSKGTIWIGTRAGGLMTMEANGGKKYYNKGNILNSDFIMSINETADGKILVGTNDGGLNILNGDNKVKYLTVNEGLVSNVVFNTYVDKEGVIWVGANGGISRIEGDSVFNFKQYDGLPIESVFDIVEDDEGYFWLPSNFGIVKVAHKQLNDYAHGISDKIEWILNEKGDGLASSECTGATTSVRTSEGKILVPTLEGVTMIDTKSVAPNLFPPPMRVNKLSIDGVERDIHRPIVVSPGKHRYIFEYSGLSFLVPNRMDFKYQIIGYDQDWNPSDERRAIYTNLPPGKFTFKVIGSNNDGLWNNEGSSLDFEVKPYFYQTNTFIAIIIASLLLLSFGYTRWRTYSIRKRNSELENVVANRTLELRNVNSSLKEAYYEIEKKNFDITSSISYARRIQQAMLPPTDLFKTLFDESFIIYKPLNIISGDFYWLDKVGNKTILAVADCTGHGVPGAFMSMVGNQLLDQIIVKNNITQPDEILVQLSKEIKNVLHHGDTFVDDGMDLSICVLDRSTNTMQFSGAMSSIYYVNNNEFHEFKGDRKYIGGIDPRPNNQFTLHTVEFKSAFTLYLSSDGYPDQFGGPQGKKFMVKRFRELLKQIYKEPMEEQKHILENTIKEWMKEANEEQIDDMQVLGIRI